MPHIDTLILRDIKKAQETPRERELKRQKAEEAKEKKLAKLRRYEGVPRKTMAQWEAERRPHKENPDAAAEGALN